MEFEAACAWCRGTPSRSHFDDLCQELGDGEVSAATLLILRTVLATWPPEVERWVPFPYVWIDATLEGRPPEALSLCTHLKTSSAILLQLLSPGTRAALENLKVLQIHGHGHAVDISQAFGRAPFRLKGLTLNDVHLSAMEMKILVETSPLERLESLTLDASSGTNETMYALAQHDGFERLRSFSLREVSMVGLAGVMALASAPWLGHLHDLDLRHAIPGPAGAQVFEEIQSRYPNMSVLLPEGQLSEARGHLTNQEFGELRSEFERTPSPKVFSRICALLDQGRPEDGVLGYARDRIARWPDVVPRTTPNAWVEKLLKGGLVEAFTLCDTVRISPRLNSDMYWEHELHFQGGSLGALLHSPHMPRLRHLIFEGDVFEEVYLWISVADMHALATCQALSELQTLHIQHACVGDEALQVLANAQNVTSLRSLSLSFNEIQGPGLAALAQSRVLGTLETLMLRENSSTATPVERFGADNLRALFTSDHLQNLRRLEIELHATELEESDLEALLEDPCTSNLEHLLLEISANARMCELLAHAPSLHSLRTLSLPFGDFGAEGLCHIADASAFSRLEALELESLEDQTSLDEGIMALASSTKLPSLQSLMFNDVFDVSRGAMEALLASPTLPKGARVRCGALSGVIGQPLPT